MLEPTAQKRNYRTLHDYFSERRELVRRMAIIRALAETSRELEIWEVRAVLDRIAEVAEVES